MSYFLLPEIHHNIDNIDIQSNEKDKIYVSLTLNSYLNNAKKQIDNNFDSWDFMKRYTNPYEFIHTTVPNTAA